MIQASCLVLLGSLLCALASDLPKRFRTFPFETDTGLFDMAAENQFEVKHNGAICKAKNPKDANFHNVVARDIEEAVGSNFFFQVI